MTLYDKIKEMNVEDMASAIAKIASGCYDCGGCNDCNGGCLSCVQEQLLLEEESPAISEKLKPCPFCGESPTLKHDWRYPRGSDDSIYASEVICENWECPIYHADNTYYQTDEEAIEAWNRRDVRGL